MKKLLITGLVLTCIALIGGVSCSGVFSSSEKLEIKHYFESMRPTVEDYYCHVVHPSDPLPNNNFEDYEDELNYRVSHLVRIYKEVESSSPPKELNDFKKEWLLVIDESKEIIDALRINITDPGFIDMEKVDVGITVLAERIGSLHYDFQYYAKKCNIDYILDLE